jgi:hypothetical protein
MGAALNGEKKAGVRTYTVIEGKIPHPYPSASGVLRDPEKRHLFKDMESSGEGFRTAKMG